MGKLPRITESAPAMNASGSVLAWVSRPEGFRASGLPCLRAAKGAMGRHEEEREREEAEEERGRGKGRERDFHSRAVTLGCGRETGVGPHSMRGERGVDSGLAKRKLSPTELQASDFISSACHVSHPVLPRSPHQRPRKSSVVSLPGKSLVRSPSPPVLRPACAHAGTLLSRLHRDSSTAKSRGSSPDVDECLLGAWISTRPTEPSNLHRMIHACSLAIAATGSEGRSGRCAGSLLAWIPLVNAQPSVTMPMNSTVDPHDRPIYARPHTSTSDLGSDLEHKGLSGPENTLGDLQKQVQALYLGKNKETESHRGLASSTALGGGVSHVVTLVVLLHGRDQLRRLLMASPCDAKIITRASGPKLNLFNKELSAPIRFFGIQKRPISEVSGIFPGIYRASRVPRNPGSPSTTAPSDHPHHRDIVPAHTGFRVAAPDEPHP
ncbi:unnamed protein product [Diplocarpon coronariae]